MRIVAAVFGLLLVLFGGGCTLIFVYGTVTDLRSMLADVPLLLTLWVPLGLLPLAAGYFLLRYGLKAGRGTTPGDPAGGPVPPDNHDGAEPP